MTLPDATPPTAEATKLAARLFEKLPLYSTFSEARSISACGSTVFLEFTGTMPGQDAQDEDGRKWLPNAERVVCIDFATRQFMKGGGSVKGLSAGTSLVTGQPFANVFDLCKDQ